MAIVHRDINIDQRNFQKVITFFRPRFTSDQLENGPRVTSGVPSRHEYMHIASQLWPSLVAVLRVLSLFLPRVSPRCLRPAAAQPRCVFFLCSCSITIFINMSEREGWTLNLKVGIQSVLFEAVSLHCSYVSGRACTSTSRGRVMASRES